MNAWALVIAFAVFVLAAPLASAGSGNQPDGQQLVQRVKTPTVVHDGVNAGDPQAQYGDPDDLGGGDQKGGGTQPPILNPNGDQSSGSLEWYQALIQLLKNLLFTL